MTGTRRTGSSRITTDPLLRLYVQHMTVSKFSEVTIGARLELLERLVRFLDGGNLLAATPVQLEDFQQTWGHLAPASVDIYTRHIRALYKWALDFDHLTVDPSRRLVRVRVPKGLPHPTRADDLKTIFACVTGDLRVAYVLAAFAGLRRGEICKLRWRDIEFRSEVSTALISGKGGKERVVPILPHVVIELERIPRVSPYVIGKPNSGPAIAKKLSEQSYYFLKEIGVETTLHSMRHTFATAAVRLTHDALLVRDLLGHSSVSTTEIYMKADLDRIHERLDGLAQMVLGEARLDRAERSAAERHLWAVTHG